MDVSGYAYVIDGDTLRIGEERIRLFGIDAPERDQRCGPAACGELARGHLQMIVLGRTVRCQGDDRDRYRRLIATCRVQGRDIGSRMVAEGWAMAYVRYSRRYLAAETRARRDRLGMWQWEVQSPEAWRRAG